MGHSLQKEKFAIEDGYKWCKKACSRGSRGSKKKVGLCVSLEDLGGEKLRGGGVWENCYQVHYLNQATAAGMRRMCLRRGLKEGIKTARSRSPGPVKLVKKSQYWVNVNSGNRPCKRWTPLFFLRGRVETTCLLESDKLVFIAWDPWIKNVMGLGKCINLCEWPIPCVKKRKAMLTLNILWNE